ncbi:MAG: histidine phosphatase family protein [Defluviitaleaceae bacterium]|nr:histidine phosphatase family protein [Defluviitaleaceae bacterium]
MELYIARHGETQFNIQRKYQGSGQDSPLTQEGIAQAKSLGNMLEGIHFDAVYSSPLKRAKDTVEIAFGDRYKPILDPRLVEIGLGAMEGMNWEEAAELYPTARLSDPMNYVPPTNGETLLDMINRVSSFLDDVAKAGHERVFVLAHGYTLRVFQACTMDKSLEALGKTQYYGNCELARYRYIQNKWEMMV